MPAPAPLDALAAFASNPLLNDPSLPTNPVSLQLPEKSIPINVPAVNGGTPGQFTLGVDVSTSVAVINSASDPDPIGFFGLGAKPQKSAEKDEDGPLIEYPATFDATKAYVILTGLEVTGKLSGKLTIGSPAALGLDGSGSLDAAVCYAFPAATPSWDAAPILLPFPTLFSVADLLAACPAPAVSRILSFGLRGTLSASLKITAQTLATTIAEQVNAALAHAGPLKLDTTAGAAVTFSASITDGYRIFATRAANGVTFCITKSKATSAGINAEIGLDIEVTVPALSGLINTAVEQATQAASGSLAAILTKPLSELDGTQQQVLAALLNRFGVPATVGDAQQALTQKINDLATKVQDRLKALVKLQLTYEWKRLTFDSMVAKFTVADAALPRYHLAILALDLDDVLSAPPTDVVVEKFLGRKTTEVNIGYGFSFGLADHVYVKSWDSLQTKFVELVTMNGSGGYLRQLSFLGKRGFEGTWFGRSQSNYAEIDASMRAPQAAPTTADFDVGLSLAFTWKNQRFGDILLDVADTGVVAKAFATDDVNAAKDLLIASGLDPAATGDAVVSLTIARPTLTRLLRALSDPDTYQSEIAPYALARALPYMPDFAERTRADRRMSVYARTWFTYLRAEDPTVPDLERLCSTSLADDSTVPVNLARREVSSEPWTVRRIGDMEGINALQRAVRLSAPMAFDLLNSQAGNFRTLFPQCTSALAALARDPFGCRTLASMLVIAAHLTAGELLGVERAVTFTWTDNNADHSVAIKPLSTLAA